MATRYTRFPLRKEHRPWIETEELIPADYHSLRCLVSFVASGWDSAALYTSRVLSRIKQDNSCESPSESTKAQKPKASLLLKTSLSLPGTQPEVILVCLQDRGLSQESHKPSHGIQKMPFSHTDPWHGVASYSTGCVCRARKAPWHPQ